MAHDPRVPALREAVQDHRPLDAVEAASCEELLRALTGLAAPFDGAADPTHVTGSAIVTDGRGRVVLHRHKRLGIWLQPGGHVDPDEEPAMAAQRETLEETGLRTAHPQDRPALLHVDAHAGPRGHRHLDVRYLLLADPEAALSPADGESTEVAWFDLDAAAEVSDASLAAALAAMQRFPGRRPANG